MAGEGNGYCCMAPGAADPSRDRSFPYITAAEAAAGLKLAHELELGGMGDADPDAAGLRRTKYDMSIPR